MCVSLVQSLEIKSFHTKTTDFWLLLNKQQMRPYPRLAAEVVTTLSRGGSRPLPSLAMPSLLKAFLPRGLCTDSPCLGYTVPPSPLLPFIWCPPSHRSQPTRPHSVIEHFSSLGPHASQTLNSSCNVSSLLPLCGQGPDALFLFGHLQPDPGLRAEEAPKLWMTDGPPKSLSWRAMWGPNDTRLAPCPGEGRDLFSSSWLSPSRSFLFGLN